MLREPSPVPPSEEEEEEVVEPAQDQEREEEWQADAQEEGGSRLVLRRRTRPRIPLRRLSGCEVPHDSQIGRYLLPCAR